MTLPPSKAHPDFGPTTQQLSDDDMCEVLPAGTPLGGFRIVELLSRGHSGNVYLALDSSLQRQVAIKEYMPVDLAERRQGLNVSPIPGADAARYADGMSIFLQRAKLLASLEHPSLPRVYGFWEENRTAYMTMAYCEGRSLAAVLEDMQRPPDEAWLRKLLAPLLGALDVLHAAQCSHGGISAYNIQVMADGSTVLLGFEGMSRTAGGAMESQAASADLHDLARVLHFAITGNVHVRHAIDDHPSTFVEAVAALQTQFPKLQYDRAFLAGIDRALLSDPKDQPRSVTEFQRWLDLAPAVPNEARQVSTAALLSRESPSEYSPPATIPSRARPRVRWPLLMAALGLATLGVGGAWRLGHTPAEPIPQTARPVSSPSEPTATSVPIAPMDGPTASSEARVSPPGPVTSAISVAVARPQAQPASAKTAVKPSVPKPDSPRAACGSRTNFSLYYCMQTQCKRPDFMRHQQCIDLKQRGELD